jgi:hypothetical protein
MTKTQWAKGQLVDNTFYRKLKIGHHKPHKKTVINSGVSEGYNSLVVSAVLPLLPIQ